MPTQPPEILSLYPQLSGQVVSITPVSGGFSGAGVWKIATKTAEFALRRWPQNGLSSTRIRGLHKLLWHVAACDLSFVAPPIMAANGSTLSEHGGRSWQVEPWLPGEPDRAKSITNEKLSAAMIALAEWHAASATFTPTPSADNWFQVKASAPSPAVAERLSLTNRWLQSDLPLVRSHIRPNTQFDRIAIELCDLARDALLAIRFELEGTLTARFHLQPCLRDIWSEHVLFEGDHVSGIIDPSACRTESIATDLARLIGSFVGDDATAWQFAIDVYGSKRPLTTNEHQLVRTLDRSAVVLSPLTWIKRRYVQKTAFDEATVLPRLSDQLRRLTFLVQSLGSF